MGSSSKKKRSQQKKKTRHSTGGISGSGSGSGSRHSKKLNPKEAADDSSVDYGATADAFAAIDDSVPVQEEEEVDEPEQEELLGSEKGGKDDDDKDEDSDDDDDKDDKQDEKEQEASSSEEEEEKEEKRDDDDDNEDDDKSSNGEDDDDSEEEAVVQETPTLSSSSAAAVAAGEEACSFDLRNLTAVNSHPLPETLLFRQPPQTKSPKSKKKKNHTHDDDEKVTINDNNNSRVLNDDYVLKKATEGCTQLIRALWDDLSTEKSPAGPLMRLPPYDVLTIPRALPPPPPKVETKWEQFAKERGIAVNAEKRSRKVWDEATQSWKFRHGYDKALTTSTNHMKSNSASGGTMGSWPIMEVGANDDPFEDPWEKARDAKHARTEQNRKSQLANQERVGVLPKGTTRRVMKSRALTRQAGKAGGAMDVQLPVGVPVDMNGKVLRGQPSTLAALKATQVSTASLGKFDKMREGEPERKLLLAQSAKKKRKLLMTSSESSGKGGGGAREQEHGLKVLQSVLQGGGVEKEKARKKGKLAKGVTAYDYEYDDGSNNPLFTKKKGRGGMGKNKKMTKKRIK